MSAFIKSIEKFTTTFPDSASLQTNTVNLTASQDETQCVPTYSMEFTSGGTEYPNNLTISIEMIDNGGTPAARVRRQGKITAGAVSVEVTVIEYGSNVTVQQGGPASLTGISVTATITSVTQGNSFIVASAHAASTSGADDYDELLVLARFNSNTEIQFERGSAGNVDQEVYWYIVESDGTDYLTEYIEYAYGASEQGPTNRTLSNTIVLVNAFIIATYSSTEVHDDPRDSWANVALTGTTTLTWQMDHGTSRSGGGTIGCWVVRASATEFDVQRFSTDVDGQITTNQTITSVDTDKTIVLGNQNVICGGGWPICNTTTGDLADDFKHTLVLTSATNIDLSRFATTAVGGNNNNIRFEVIEFKFETAGVNITVPVKVFDIASQVPVISSGVSVIIPIKAFNFTSFIPTVTISGAGINIVVPLKILDLVAQIPRVGTSTDVVAVLKSFNLNAQIPSVETGVGVAVPLKTFNMVGQIPQIIINTNVIVPAKVFIINGQVPLIHTGSNVIVPIENFNFITHVPIIETGLDIVILVPAYNFVLQTSKALVTAFDPDAKEFTLNLTPPIEDEAMHNYLVENFDALHKLLDSGDTATFTTTDGKTVVVKGGFIKQIS